MVRFKLEPYGINQCTNYETHHLLLSGILRTHIVPIAHLYGRDHAVITGNRPASEGAAAPTVRNVCWWHGAFADGSSWAKSFLYLKRRVCM